MNSGNCRIAYAIVEPMLHIKGSKATASPILEASVIFCWIQTAVKVRRSWNVPLLSYFEPHLYERVKDRDPKIKLCNVPTNTSIKQSLTESRDYKRDICSRCTEKQHRDGQAKWTEKQNWPTPISVWQIAPLHNRRALRQEKYRFLWTRLIGVNV